MRRTACAKKESRDYHAPQSCEPTVFESRLEFFALLEIDSKSQTNNSPPFVMMYFSVSNNKRRHSDRIETPRLRGGAELPIKPELTFVVFHVFILLENSRY
jgi:hypothetical protein